MYLFEKTEGDGELASPASSRVSYLVGGKWIMAIYIIEIILEPFQHSDGPSAVSSLVGYDAKCFLFGRKPRRMHSKNAGPPPMLMFMPMTPPIANADAAQNLERHGNHMPEWSFMLCYLRPAVAVSRAWDRRSEGGVSCCPHGIQCRKPCSPLLPRRPKSTLPSRLGSRVLNSCPDIEE